MAKRARGRAQRGYRFRRYRIPCRSSGPAPTCPGACFAFGYGYLGLTMAAVAGRIVADLIDGRTPEVDVAPYRADRF